MSRLEAEQLHDPEQVFIAPTLRIALRAEDVLTTAGIDYAVVTEAIGRTLLFRSERMGAVFYVNARQATYCRQQLTAAGFTSGVVDVEQ